MLNDLKPTHPEYDDARKGQWAPRTESTSRAVLNERPLAYAGTLERPSFFTPHAGVGALTVYSSTNVANYSIGAVAGQLPTEMTVYIAHGFPKAVVENGRSARLVEAAQGRIKELEDGLEKGEILRQESRTDLINFLAAFQPSPPSIFLLDSGNLRASWSRGKELYFGIQFIGNGVVHYNSLGPMLQSGQIARSGGLIPMQQVVQHIQSLGLMELLTSEG